MPFVPPSLQSHKLRRVQSHIYHTFRRFPVPIILLGAIFTLCPLALLRFISVRKSEGPVIYNDALVPPSGRDLEESIFGGRLNHVKSWLKESPVLLAPDIRDEGVVRRRECPNLARNPNKVDFDLANLTYTLTDLSSDGDAGVWDEAMEQRYKLRSSDHTNDTEKLLVYIVPFSHADPGWLSTVEEYFFTSTKFALDNMLSHLTIWPDMTFIWAETSYFKMWWETLSQEKMAATKELLKSGRLEIVNGGYVMPDEANCHYYAILNQYVYGHQWLAEHLGVRPDHGFSIDPFGHSSTMPYLLKNLDLKTIFIQRIHYNLRKFLAQNNATEFSWEQPWDQSEAASIFTHLAPHHLYTIKNICSLSPINCYLFDFKDAIQPWDKKQVMENAPALLEQFRKTASIYPHNVVLYILGDDFRWAEEHEWQNQYNSYSALIKEINGNPANNAVVRFGTLKDYYQAVSSRSGSGSDSDSGLGSGKLPKVQGDFFPYADKYEDYWTGYFTSRPFYKQMSRELERDLRTAEILYVLARMAKRQIRTNYTEDLIGLQRATVSLGLFQHHDAITGTSKRMVALDYGNKLQDGLLMAHAVILKNMYRLSKISSHLPVTEANIILENYRPSAISLPVKSVLRFTDTDTERRVFIFNPLLRTRDTMIHLFADTPNLLILDTDGKRISYQVTPALDDMHAVGHFLDVLRISFFIRLAPLALKAITVQSLGPRSKRVRVAERLSCVIRTNEAGVHVPGFKIMPLPTEDSLLLQNPHFAAKFSPDTGSLESIRCKKGVSHKTFLEFKRYETQASGAYLFRPSGIGDIFPYPITVRLIEGPLFSELQTITATTVLHITRIYNTSSVMGRYLELETILDLARFMNAELILKVTSDVRSNMTFYTDSNGFQILRRKVSHNVPWAANYYPATTMAYLQDKHSRLTFHLTQAHGVGSLKSGELEVMLDRNLLQDDNRGVGEPLQDLQTIRTNMALQVETEGFNPTSPYSNPTDTATLVNLHLNNPPYVTFEQSGSNITAFDYEAIGSPLPCDVHLVMMKPVSFEKEERRVGIMLHRMGMDCSRNTSEVEESCHTGKDSILLNGIFKDGYFKSYNETGFNFVNARRISIKTPVKVAPMAITAVTVTLAPP